MPQISMDAYASTCIIGMENDISTTGVSSQKEKVNNSTLVHL
jgi:hypothetical protein